MDSSFLEGLRYIILSLGIFLLGINIAFFIYAPKIIGASKGWRIYVLGQTMLTVYVIHELGEDIHSDNYSVSLPWVAIGYIFMVAGLYYLRRTYRKLPYGRRIDDR